MNAFLFRVAGFGLLFLALPAIAEEDGKIEELQRVIDAQELQLAAQQSKGINLRVDYARSDDSDALYLGVGEAF